MEATKGEVTGHALKLEEELEHSKRVQGETADRLVSRSADVESVTRSLASILCMSSLHSLTQENLHIWMPEQRAHSSVRLLVILVLLHFKWFFAHF